VRVAIDGPRVVADPQRRLPGRGAYVHPRAACVTVPGLSRALKRGVSAADVQRIVAGLGEIGEMSPAGDNSGSDRTGSEEDTDHPRETASDLNYGLARRDTVETPPRISITSQARDARKTTGTNARV
jgi:hypothetical protein